MILSPTARKIRTKFSTDFDFYAQKCLNIRTKNGHIGPFFMNQAQRYVHKALEEQLKQQGHIRALIVKGRQQGISTYVSARFFWKLTHGIGRKGFALSHMEMASRNLKNIMQRFYTYCPPIMRPKLTLSNQKALRFGDLDSGYKIGTANSNGVGRSDTIQLFHGSEVAYWANARDHISGILQSIPHDGQSEVILETTSNGPRGVFFELCEAAKSKHSSYKVIFVPWFWQNEYSLTAGGCFEMSPDEVNLAERFGLSIGQIAWRRQKITELGGHWRFRREYPSTLEEAFHSDTPGALWNRQGLEHNRVKSGKKPKSFKRIVVAIDPAVTHRAKSDETGIIVAGLSGDDHAYVLDDLSGRYSPAGWASVAIKAYENYGADRIVVETNQGGDMAVHTLKTIDANIPVKKLHASRGKWARAEPVAALDEQGRIHHVGRFDILEDQMCAFKPGQMSFSPDRVDARVWAVTELLLSQKAAQPIMWQP